MNDRAAGVTPDKGKTVPPRVLVVDDTEGNRYAITHLLRATGLQVLEAETGKKGIELLDERPDLVILDINLPDISGREVLEHIRSDPEMSWLPVMHVTASFTGSQDHAEGLDRGADAYLTHPIDPPVFLATTRSLLRLSKAEDRVRRASQEWRAAFDSLSDAIFIVASSGGSHRKRIQRCNLAAAKLLSLEPAEVIGNAWDDALEKIGAPRDSLLHNLDDPNSADTDRDDIELAGTWYSASIEHSRGIGEEPSFYVCVLRDINERKIAEREREELITRAESARRDAETANRAKGDFLAVMSHELRTPLNAIGGYVDLIQMGIRGPVTEEQQSDLARIKRSQSSLTILINDVLNFAKAESGELEYHITTFTVASALERASEVVEHQLEHRGLKFERVECDAALLIKADVDKVQQIILNLLSNAIKFTPSGGLITLASPKSADGQILITVADTGAGIPEQKREAIFEPFVQAHENRNRADSGGVGLGLAISRDLARGMGGDLFIEESGPDGTIFSLLLPAG